VIADLWARRYVVSSISDCRCAPDLRSPINYVPWTSNRRLLISTVVDCKFAPTFPGLALENSDLQDLGLLKHFVCFHVFKDNFQLALTFDSGVHLGSSIYHWKDNFEHYPLDGV